MMDENENQIKAPVDYFPMEKPREKQLKALDFIRRAYERGYDDIVIAAPTGLGKAAIGSAVCLWAQQRLVQGQYAPGGYYLVTQKLLQDQLDGDIGKFKREFQKGCTLKSATEYPCPDFGTCFAGLQASAGGNVCSHITKNECTYRKQKALFQFLPLSVTNYPYFFTEKTYVGAFENRQVIVADECHTLERQILGFVEIVVSCESVFEWTPHLRPVPRMDTLEEFTEWMTLKYQPALNERISLLQSQFEDDPTDNKVQAELNATINHVRRNSTALDSIQADPDNWVYWQENKEGELESIAKPISAAPFTKSLLFDSSQIRLYMSAFPGPKGAFCRSLGLTPEKVAWLSLASTFPVENRPIHMTMVGSMGRKSIENTMPSVLRMCERILKAHAKEKGLIHCGTYAIGATIYKYLAPLFPGRVLFPKSAKERDVCFMQHTDYTTPTVLLSPSMTEGFNLQDDLARFQIITKCSFPSLGDRQVAAKHEQDPEWYSMQAAMAVLQACGRGVRSETDHAVTYILDSDFKMLYDRHPDFFPGWFTESFIWHKPKN